MPRKRFLLALILLSSITGVVLCAECDSTPAKEVNLDLWSMRSLLSPDQRWKFSSVGPHSPEKKAPLYIQNIEHSTKWLVGWIERSGTAFWSGDSKRLFLRDEYAADDTKIRVFDLTGAIPKEIKGLDDKIQKALFAHIPKNKTTQWLYYPEVCFAANDSSRIIVLADAPLVPKYGSGKGTAFNLTLVVNLNTLQIADSSQTFNEDVPQNWRQLDAHIFSLMAPGGWEFHQLTGIDSYVGEIAGDGLSLRFDFGRCSNGYLNETKKSEYIITHKSIGGFPAKIVSPRAAGHGVTGVYFGHVAGPNALCLWGRDLSETQQNLALKIFETIRFGHGQVPGPIPPPA
jgi:hypothetical protein